MKYRYLEVMDLALSAYSAESIDSYIEEVTKNGLTEHGFARLTANIGIMIANGKRPELYERLLSMMDFCTAHVSSDRAANDFSVSELILSIGKLAKSGAVPKAKIALWYENLKKPIEFATSENDVLYNWALFSAFSEYMRMNCGLREMNIEYMDMQIATQLKHLNPDGMYMDPACPMVYDLVPRMLFSLLLFYGYDGKYKRQIDTALKTAGLLSLRMQSTSGEIPYGGRSNQFYHNEACQCAIFEYEASRYKKAGELALASQFKKAALASLLSVADRLGKAPIHHIKNRFPTQTKFGCEDYAYFNKYMITCASFASFASEMCDESIEAAAQPLTDSDVLVLRDEFHKVFLRFEDYFAELDTNAQQSYDSSGLGRIHKHGAPSEICLSCTGTALGAFNYPDSKRLDFSICAGTLSSGEPIFKTQGKYTLVSSSTTREYAYSRFECELDGKILGFDCNVSHRGVTVTAKADGMAAIMLPVLHFNGEEHSDISFTTSSITVKYGGHMCKFSTNGAISYTERIGCNRNGEYKIFYAFAPNTVRCDIEIE